jgi:hypothetical protein
MAQDGHGLGVLWVLSASTGTVCGCIGLVIIVRARGTRVWIAGDTGGRGRDSRNDLEHDFERNEPDEQDSLAPAGGIDYAWHLHRTLPTREFGWLGTGT